MFSGEATDINVIVFGVSRPGLEPTIYSTRGKHANHYATDAVDDNENDNRPIYIDWLVFNANFSNISAISWHPIYMHTN